MTRPYGMAEKAFRAYIGAMHEAGINPVKTSAGTKRVLQTIGTAKASAGTHAKDGTLEGNPYCAAVDISTRHDINGAELSRLLKALWNHGFVAWHRDWTGNEHIHAVYAGVYMKRSLRGQVHSFLKKRSGLVGDRTDPFVANNLTNSDAQTIREFFLDNNQAVGNNQFGDSDITEDNYEEVLEDATCCTFSDEEPAEEDE